jgi:septum site-determining protein MinC
MSQAPSLAFAGVTGITGVAEVDDGGAEAPAHVTLRGTTRGLEVLIVGTPSAAALGARLTELLAEAPGFFAGSHARIAIDGVLPVGALACLEEVAARFELRIVEIGPVARRGRLEVAAAPRTVAGTADRSAARTDALAEGTGPIADDAPALRRDDPRAVPIPALPPSLRGASDPGEGAGPAEPNAVPRTAGPCASDALVSAAAALVSAAAALTNESSTGPLRAMQGSASGPTEAAGSGPIAGSAAACKAADPVCADAACKAAADLLCVDAACKVATDPPSGDAACKVATDPPSVDAACKATPAVGACASDADAGKKLPEAAAKAAALVGTSPEAAAKAAAVVGTSPEAAAKAAAEAAPAGIADPGLWMALAMLSASAQAAADAASAAAANDAAPVGPRLVIGPVRSGRIVDHVGHLIVVGDVNPGAEVRAEGSIIVLGRLRGVAHAAIGRDAGCIIALSLQPQQLRIGRMVARAGDADRPSGGAEIAYATGETIVVERFSGRLPSGLAASM